jgi:hypothetical protein
MKKASWMAAAALAVWAAFPAAARSATGGWTWPVHGPVITQYANDDARPYAGGMHRGIDIAAAVGAKVVAARGGEVTYAGALGSAGITVAIRTDGGRYLTSYLHLDRVDVERGAHVATGARVGAVGTTGRRSAERPHLHFGVRFPDRDHHYVDPLVLLPRLGGGSSSPPALAPLTAPAPVRAQPAPVPARALAEAGQARLPLPQLAPTPRGTLAPVPAGPAAAPVREGTPKPGPIPAPVPVTRDPAGGLDWGKLVFCAGLALALAALAGRALWAAPARAIARLLGTGRRERAKQTADAEATRAVPPIELAPQVQ